MTQVPFDPPDHARGTPGPREALAIRLCHAIPEVHAAVERLTRRAQEADRGHDPGELRTAVMAVRTALEGVLATARELEAMARRG